jgi:transposase
VHELQPRHVELRVELRTRQRRRRHDLDECRQEGRAVEGPLQSLGGHERASDTKKLWRSLTVFLGDPDVPMHSNDIERAMCGPAVGRKNHYRSRNMTTAAIAEATKGSAQGLQAGIIGARRSGGETASQLCDQTVRAVTISARRARCETGNG